MFKTTGVLYMDIDREKEKEIENELERQSERNQEDSSEKDSSSTTTHTGARACAYAREIPQEEADHYDRQLDVLMDYAEAAGLPNTQAMRAYNRRLLIDGFDHRVLIAAMDETMLAPRPSWRYYAAIIRKLEARGCKMWFQWQERQRLFRAVHS